MHIDFVRTGGFAGMRLAVSLESHRLPEDQSVRLEKMVSDAGFFGLPSVIMPPSTLPDRFEYQISISSTGRSHSIVVSESVVPDKLRPLLDLLTTLAVVTKHG